MCCIPPEENSGVKRSVRDASNLRPNIPIDQFVLRHSPRHPLLKRIRRDRLIPRPSGDLAQEDLESLEINPRFELAR